MRLISATLFLGGQGVSRSSQELAEAKTPDIGQVRAAPARSGGIVVTRDLLTAIGGGR